VFIFVVSVCFAEAKAMFVFGSTCDTVNIILT